MWALESRCSLWSPSTCQLFTRCQKKRGHYTNLESEIWRKWSFSTAKLKSQTQINLSFITQLPNSSISKRKTTKRYFQKRPTMRIATHKTSSTACHHPRQVNSQRLKSLQLVLSLSRRRRQPSPQNMQTTQIYGTQSRPVLEMNLKLWTMGPTTQELPSMTGWTLMKELSMPTVQELLTIWLRSMYLWTEARQRNARRLDLFSMRVSLAQLTPLHVCRSPHSLTRLASRSNRWQGLNTRSNCVSAS